MINKDEHDLLEAEARNLIANIIMFEKYMRDPKGAKKLMVILDDKYAKLGWEPGKIEAHKKQCGLDGLDLTKTWYRGFRLRPVVSR